MPLTKNQIRFIESLVNYWTEKTFYACRVYSYDQKLHGFKVKITKYQLKKQIGLGLNKNCQYNILGFDFNICPLTQKVSGISEPGFCKTYRFFFTTSILVKVAKNILVEYMDTDGF